MAEDISDIRNEYSRDLLNENTIHPDPFIQFGRWMSDALRAGIDEPAAMTLATVSADNRPSARMVLLKGFDQRGFIFFTNYESRKGREIEVNPQVDLVFHWKELERQVRIEGAAEKISGSDSDEYFASRPEGSQVSAIISPQSQVIPDRQYLENRKSEYLGNHQEKHDRPSAWGGYIIIPQMIEFWQGRPDRLHDRMRYTRRGERWMVERLAP